MDPDLPEVMSTSSNFAVSGQKYEKLPEKTMFTQTCTRLREYLKERGPLGGELSLGMSLGGPENAAATPEASNFFPQTNEKTPGFVPSSWNMSSTPRNLKPMNMFLPQPNYGSSEDLPMMSGCVNKPAAAATPEPEKAQMTIFYAGQVIVFNDFPANKAKEVMRLASMGSSKNPNNNTFPSNSVGKPIDSVSLIPSSNVVPNNMANVLPQEGAAKPPMNLPIARKASLARFLEKRKDRINARAPYNMIDELPAHSKPVESKSWLGLSPQSSSAV